MNSSSSPALLLQIQGASSPARYKPGQSVRFSWTCALAGVLTAMSSPSLILDGPTGSQDLSGAITADSPTGTYHADLLVPITAAAGIWTARIRSSGNSVDQNALIEPEFIVEALGF